MWIGYHNNRLYPAGIYHLKVNNENTRTRYEICPKLTIKIPEQLEQLVKFELANNLLSLNVLHTLF